jgi:dipicolinate synthase subunit A
MPYTEDGRMRYAADYLTECGFEYTDDVDKADFAVLPVPSKEYMFNNLDRLTVFYGMGRHRDYNYAAREDYLLANAFLTAEGAVAFCEENTEISLYRAEVLITGYGRIAKALHGILAACGANVTVCSRSKESEIQALYNGARHVGFDALKFKNSNDIVFNTVPHIVFTESELSALKDGAVLIDLSSFPGGVDTLCAAAAGINLIDGRGLPSKYCKKTAGILIGKAVADIIKEEKL